MSNQNECVLLDSDYNTTIAANDSLVKEASDQNDNAVTIKDLNKENIYVLLQDSDTYAFTLLTICLIAYGENTFKVDPLVLFQNLKEDFRAELCEENQNKLSAILTALTTNFFFSDLSVFKSICETLTDGDPGVFDPNFDDPTTVEVLWGMYEVNLAYDENKEDYSEAIKKFVESTMQNDVEDPEESGLQEGETYQEAIYDNVAELKQQLKDIGLKDIPKFPVLDI